MKYRTIIEQDEDGNYTVQCPALPGCISEGKTRVEALANIKDAITGILKVRRKHRLPIPQAQIAEVEVAV